MPTSATRCARLLFATALATGALAGPTLAQLTPNEKAVAHFLRRMSFGPRPGQTALLAQNFPTDVIAYMNTQLAGNAPELPGYTTYLTTNWTVPLDASGQPNYGGWSIGNLAAQRVARAIASENQLREVMTAFWQMHFNTNYGKEYSYFLGNQGLLANMVDATGVPITNPTTAAAAAAAWVELQQHAAFRADALGSFRDLLYDSAKGTAMLIFLDNVGNVSDPGCTKKANENYARELMELHTLGVSEYDGINFEYIQSDVVGLAKAFTGWGFQAITGGPGGVDWTFSFDSTAHCDATGNVFTSMSLSAPLNLSPYTGVAQGDTVLDYLAASPETSVFVCSKLIEFFVGHRPRNPLDPNFGSLPIVVSPTYDADLISLLASCASAWSYGGVVGNISKVLETIFSSPAFFAAESYWQRVRLPIDALASMIRGYDAVWPDAAELQPAMWVLENDLNQYLFRYGGPDGFPWENLEQLSTSRYLFRVNFAQSLHRRYNLPDASGTVGYTSGINWHYLRFLLHDLLIYDPTTNFNLMIAYLQLYPAITPYLDLGSSQAIVDRVAEGVLQGDADPALKTQMQAFLDNIPPVNVVGTLQTLIQQSNPQTNPTGWVAAFTEHGLRVNLFMSYAASLPQATLD